MGCDAILPCRSCDKHPHDYTKKNTIHIYTAVKISNIIQYNDVQIKLSVHCERTKQRKSHTMLQAKRIQNRNFVLTLHTHTIRNIHVPRRKEHKHKTVSKTIHSNCNTTGTAVPLLAKQIRGNSG